MRKQLLGILFALALLGSLSLQSCNPHDEKIQILRQMLESIRTFAKLTWLMGGNAFLVLDSDAKNGVVIPIDFRQEPYPVNEITDVAFFTKKRLQGILGSSHLQRFGLTCGKKLEENLQTDIVFWSGDYWDGTKQSFKCGGTSAYEIVSSLDQAGSICVVTESTPSNRRARCLNGPRCDDGRQNGNESDIDCGGSCSRCREGRSCNANGDCARDSCQGGVCKLPTSTCNDHIKNQDETDVDCGGSCKDCSDGKQCRSPSDCQSGNCQGGVCKPKPTCNGSPAGSSAGTYRVFAVDIFGCGWLLDYCANSLNAAKGCAQEHMFTPVSQLREYWLGVVEMPGTELYRWAPDDQNAFSCARGTFAANYNYYVLLKSDPVYQSTSPIGSCP